MNYLKSFVKPIFDSKIGILLRNITGFKSVGFIFPRSVENYSCSDLFIWRTDNGYETVFRFSDIPSIYYKIKNSIVLFIFYDEYGVEVKKHEIMMNSSICELKIDKNFLNIKSDLGSFVIFHLIDNEINEEIKITNRCYVGYKKDNSILSFMHGNIEAQYIDLKSENLQIRNDVAKVQYRTSTYLIQKNMSDYDYSELIFTNPCASDVWVIVNGEKENLKPNSILIVRSKKTDIVRIESNMSMPRPIIFSYKGNYFDCHHG